MKKITLCIVLFLPFVYIYSQDLDHYYVEIKEGFELGEIQKTINADQTLTLSMQNTDLTDFASGLYSIILVCDGEIQGSKNLSKL